MEYPRGFRPVWVPKRKATIEEKMIKKISYLKKSSTQMCLFSNNACKYDKQKWRNNRPSAYENLLLLNNIMMNRWYKCVL